MAKQNPLSILSIISLLLGWCFILPPVGGAEQRPSAATSCASSATPAAQPGGTPLAAGTGTPVASGASALRQVADVPLPGGATRFDYQSLDPTTGRLAIAHMGDGELIVVDTKTQAVVGTVKDLPKITGVLAIPELGRIYASVAGAHQVAVIDEQSLAVVARLGTIGFPDGLDYAPTAKRVFVSDESGGGELVIDAAAESVVGTIDIGGEAGNTRYDAASGCVIVAVQNQHALVMIDPQLATVVDRIDTGSQCDGPHGFTLDPSTRRAFVSCENNAALVVVDLATSAVSAPYPVGEGPDVLAFDPGLARLYVASESGTVSVFQERDGALEPLGELSMPHAHSVAVDPATHLVYFPLENIDGKPVLRIMSPGI